MPRTGIIFNRTDILKYCHFYSIFKDQEESFTIYPNPIENVLLIRYDLPQNSLVNITIRDLSGRLISVLVNETQQQGVQFITLNAAILNPGIYFCLLNTGEGVRTMKMVKLH